MLLVQTRKRSRARFDLDHAISHPASWKTPAQDDDADPLDVEEIANQRADFGGVVSGSAIATLSLDQLQDLSVLVAERIQIKKRYNSTPLRRIISRQATNGGVRITTGLEEDAASQTDTLVNTETVETLREPVEVRRRRYNNTPLRRIISRQVRSEEAEDFTHCTRFEPEPLEVRRARYNNTPLRRILSRQASPEAIETPQATARSLPPVSQTQSPAPVPRSNTPLRRILSRQTSTQPAPKKEDDDISERADSVIDPDSPVRSHVTATVLLNSEARIRAYETELWKLTMHTSLSPPAPAAGDPPLDSEPRIRVQDDFPALKEKGITVSVTELASARKPKRIVVDSKGSPLRRILQRQTSREWRAPARVGVV